MVISNVWGNITRRINYQANGQWINLNSLPTGTYFASTYGSGITFIR
jgi:hypothetical protein